MGVATMKVPTIFTAVDRFSSVVSKMTASTSAFGKTAEAAAERTSRKMRNLGSNMMIASGAMVASLAYPVHKAVEFEDQIASIGTLLPNLNLDGLKQLGNEILRMAEKTSTPIDVLTKSYYDLISAGVSQKDAMSWMRSSDRLAIAGLGSHTDSINITLAAMRNFQDSFKNSNEAANALFKTVKYGKTTVEQLGESFAGNAVFAGQLGMSGQEYMASIAAITTSTLPTSQAENAIGMMSNYISKASEKKNKLLFSIIKKLGVKSGTELLIKKGGLLPALMAIKNEAEKTGQRLEPIFNLKAASTAFLMLTKNTAVIDKYKESLLSIRNKSEDAIGIAFNLKMATGKFGVGMLKNNLDSVAITVGTILIPSLIELTKYLNPLLKRFSDWIKLNPGAITGFAKLAIGIGAVGLAITTGGWMVKLWGFILFIKNSMFGEAIALGFTMAAESIGMSVLALTGWVGLIIAGITAVVLMIVYWDEVTTWFAKKQQKAVDSIGNGWLGLTKSLENSGFGKYFEDIGMKLNPILHQFEMMFRVLEKINFMGAGKVFGFTADSLKDAQSKVYANSKNPYFSPNSGAGGSWDNSETTFSNLIVPENLAGKKNNSNDANVSGGKSGTFTLNVNDPKGTFKPFETFAVQGIPVQVSYNQGAK